MPRVLKVIQSEIKRGAGVDLDPIRHVTQYHTEEGDFLAEKDDWVDTLKAEEIKRDYIEAMRCMMEAATKEEKKIMTKLIVIFEEMRS